jgi:predicted nucleic acid-binding protein
MSGPPRNATVLDTTVLSNFAHVDRVELLLELPRLVTVEAVQRELDDGMDTHSYLTNAVTALGTEIPVVSPSETTAEIGAELLETLDPGETQALAVADVADGILVTDDGDARRTAKRRGVGLTGSIGLLVRFVDDGQLSVATADSYLKCWIDEAGFRSPSRDVRTFLDD